MGLAEFEGDLVATDRWEYLYGEMPPECQRLVDEWAECETAMEFIQKQGGPVGIGRNDELGWFIACCGQGPFIAWSEVALR
jgi:hypothetical protein